MAYNENIPQPVDRLDKSQADLLANFQALKTLIDVNHVTFGASGEGKHKWLSCPVQSSTPTFASGENGFYNKNYTVTGKNELYVHKQSNSGAVEVPMTASILGSTTPSANSSGWTKVPSGIIFRWQHNINGSGLVTVTLSGSGTPAFTRIYNIILTLKESGSSDVNKAVRLVSIDSATQFKVYFSNRTTTGAASGTCNALIIGI